MTSVTQEELNFSKGADGVFHLKRELSQWQKTVIKAGGIAVVALGTVFGGGAMLNESIRQQDLANCEQKPHTLACQERYQQAATHSYAPVQASVVPANDPVAQIIKRELGQ